MSIRSTRLAPIVAIAGLAIALARVAAGADSSPEPSPVARAKPVIKATAAVKTASVDTIDFSYHPNPLIVKVGTRVDFKNSDDAAHTVTSINDGPAPAFESGDMPKNATWSHVFTKRGTYPYGCRYHGYMRGTIIVR